MEGAASFSIINWLSFVVNLKISSSESAIPWGSKGKRVCIVGLQLTKLTNLVKMTSTRSVLSERNSANTSLVMELASSAVGTCSNSLKVALML